MLIWGSYGILDVNECCRQIQGKVPVPGQDHYTSMMDCFRKIIKNEGWVCERERSCMRPS